jgi:hypothetical protein
LGKSITGERVRRLCFLFLCIVLFTACGYRVGRGGSLVSYSTVCIPYVQGDDTGLFTDAIIHTVVAKTNLNYCSQGADLTLKVCLLQPINENIGFAYAPNDERGLAHVIVSNEARLTLTAEVTLLDQCSGRCLMGPTEITYSIDYDFEPDLSNVNFHAFALGQLEMNNLAQDAAFPPLYTLLAEKIVDYVNYSW